MSWPASPPWLLDLQGRFGAVLRQPLERTSGALRAETGAYDATLVQAVQPNQAGSASERLAVYHRQYWFRLLTVLQGLFPLTARLLGYWQFNELAARHLVAHPPLGYDIDTIGEGFEQGVAQGLLEAGSLRGAESTLLDAAAVVEAARIDAAFHRVTRAAPQVPFRPTAEDVGRLLRCSFELSPAVALLDEHWSLCERRLTLLERESDAQLEPGALGSSAERHWLLARHNSQLGLVPLEPLEAELLRLLQREPLEKALARLEASATAAERTTLSDRARAWLARSVHLGVWRGLREL